MEPNQQNQKKYLELQILTQQINQLQQYLTTIESNVLELNSLKESINQISKTKKSSEILTPLGKEIFVKTELKENKKVLEIILTEETLKELDDIFPGPGGEAPQAYAW